VTTAPTHDSQVDLSEKGEVVYCDKAYFGVSAKGYDAMMKRGTGAGPIFKGETEECKDIKMIPSSGYSQY